MTEQSRICLEMLFDGSGCVRHGKIKYCMPRVDSRYIKICQGIIATEKTVEECPAGACTKALGQERYERYTDMREQVM